MEEFVSKFNHLNNVIEKISIKVTETDLGSLLEGSKWTKAQIIHHSCDGLMNHFVRMKQILGLKTPTILDVDLECWISLSDSRNTNVNDSILILNGLTNKILTLLISVSSSDLTRIGKHPIYGDVNLSMIVSLAYDHTIGHLEQILV